MKEDKTLRILVADDDMDDRMLMKDAFEESRLANPVDFVVDGVDMLAYLKREGKYEALKSQDLPCMILLDLNMPRMDGRTALSYIKTDPKLRNIPVVVLTTSQSDRDIFQTYDLGVNSFITKPVIFDDLVDIIKTIKKYWIEIVSLPAEIV